MNNQTLKRAADVAAAALGLLAVLPVVLGAAIAIVMADGRPAFFIQQRTGKDEVTFDLVKLRTLRSGDADDDDRRFAVGEFMRRWSIDELPSLVNILRGEMSFVGPRPLLPEYLERYSAAQRRRHEVRPGLTGLAQVSGRNQVAWEKRFELDVTYIDTWSIRGDLKILWRSFGALSSSGIYPESGRAQAPFLGEAESER